MFYEVTIPRVNPMDSCLVHRNAWISFCNYIYSATNDPWTPHHVYNSNHPINVEHVGKDKYGPSIIFLTPFKIEEFLHQMQHKIIGYFILITFCYGPVSNVSEYVANPKLLAWFGQANNDAIRYSKFHLIPVGILSTNELFDQRKELFQLTTKLRNIEKVDKLYINFTVHEGRVSDRNIIYDSLKGKSYCVFGSRKPFHNYLEEMARYKYVLSPKGDMYDCYRHWEALLVGCIIVIEASSLNAIFDQLSL